MRKLSFQGKIFFYFTLILILMGALVLLIWSLPLFQFVLEETRSRVKIDLGVTRKFLDKEAEKSVLILALLADKRRLVDSLEKSQPIPSEVESWIQKKRADSGFDFLSLCDREGEVILRTRFPYHKGDSVLSNPLVLKASQGENASGILIIPAEFLKREGEGLSSQAYVQLVSTPRAHPRSEEVETSGMVLAAAVPVCAEDGTIIGVLYGGILLNRNYELVDRIRDMVFEEKEYKGRPLGTVTIFQEDVRITTNVREKDGSRAIGTRVSREVYEKVLKKGDTWLGRAFVVNSWYISAYEPIYSPEDKIIGMLYVGILENKYVDVRNRAFLSFLPIFFGGIVAVLILSYLLARGLSEPIKRLIKATDRITKGKTFVPSEGEEKYPRIETLPYREIQELIGNFNRMAVSLYKRETELKKANKDLMQVNRHYMEMLGFVTHEIKNRIGIILGSAHNLSQGVVGTPRGEQKKMVDILLRNSERLSDMIKNYLDLSRIERKELEVNKEEVEFRTEVLEVVLREFESQLQSKDMRFHMNTPHSLKIMADPDLLKIVMENLLSNAIKYGTKKGAIEVNATKEGTQMKVSVWNAGEGIPKEKRDRLFIKFMRLRGEKFREERGSGLGLFVTKEIIQKHGGKIWVESEEGKWVNFIFTLPAE